jgi:hypothetical protein
MAGKLCYLVICERDVEPSIACGYDIGDVINLQAGLLQCLSHDVVGKAAMLWAGRALDGGKLIAALVYEHDFGHGRAYINAGEVQMDLLMTCY